MSCVTVRDLFVVVIRAFQSSALCALVASCIGCESPNPKIVLDNDYPPSSGYVIYQAQWSAESFTTPIPPGTSSDGQDGIAASANTAYVLLAPGWEPSNDGGTSTPTAFIALQSINGFEVHLDSTLYIPVDDTTFAGNCAAGSLLTQDQADFIIQRVFRKLFTGLSYTAATCTTTVSP